MIDQKWEFFRDICYYDLWAVRPVGDKDFSSQKLFHVQSKEEAQALAEAFNTRTPDIDALTAQNEKLLKTISGANLTLISNVSDYEIVRRLRHIIPVVAISDAKGDT